MAALPVFKRPINRHAIPVPIAPLTRTDLGPTVEDIRAMIADGRITLKTGSTNIYELNRERLGMIPIVPPVPIVVAVSPPVTAPREPYVAKVDEVDELARPVVKRKLSVLEKKINQRPVKKISRPKM
jgi:hypothetical protein